MNRADSGLIAPEDRQLALGALNLTDATLLAVGTEAEVYARDESTVLKLYADSRRLPYLETLQRFYESLDTRQSGLSLPRIHAIATFGNMLAVIESRIDGYPLKELLPETNDHRRAEDLYLNTVWKLKEIRVTKPPKTYLLFDKDGISDAATQSFERFYAQLLERKIQRVRPFFASSHTENATALINAIRGGATAKLSVVHGDFCPGNVLVDKTLTQVFGVVDFGSFTMFGNSLLDVAGAFGFCRMYDPERVAIRRKMLPRILERLDDDEKPLFFQYLLANAILTSDLYASGHDPRTDDHFRWAAEIVSDESYWRQAL